MESQDLFFERLFLDRQAIGESFYGAVADAMVGQSQNESYRRFLAYSLTLLGEPDLSPWLGTPVPLEVTAPTTIEVGDSLLVVQVSRLGQPLGGATVCVSKEDEQEVVHAVAVTGPDGVADVSFRPTSTGAFAVAVTAPGSIPHQETPERVVLPAEGGDLNVVDLVVRDIDIGWPAHGDSRLEEGETVLIDIVLRNGGTVPAGGTLSLAIRPDSLAVFLELLDAFEDVAPVDPGEGLRLEGAFQVRPIAPIPESLHQNRDRLPFVAVVRIESREQVEEFELPLPCYRPVLEIDLCKLKELPGGNGDGFPDAGETFKWWPILRDIGTGATANLTGTLEAVAGMEVLDGSRTLEAEERYHNVATTRPFGFQVIGANPRARFRVRSAFDRAISIKSPRSIPPAIRASTQKRLRP